MNLDSAPSGRAVTLDRPDLGGDRARRLAELGLRAGSTVTPLHRTAGGGRVLGVGGARIAVARAVLRRLRLDGSPAAPVPGNDPLPVVPPVQVSVPPCHGPCGAPARTDTPVVALAGSPNVGKSTLFNALTGARRQVGNWPGTSVEVGRGAWQVEEGRMVTLVDLPGTYSLDPVSPDEALTRALLVDAAPEQIPDLVVLTADATDLARGLYLLRQVREHPLRVVLALTMTDVARRRAVDVDLESLAAVLGVPVVPLDPRRREGLDALACAVSTALGAPAPPRLSPLTTSPAHEPCEPPRPPDGTAPGPHSASAVPSPQETLTAAGSPEELRLADARFAWVTAVVRTATRAQGSDRTWSDRIDRVATSPLAGPWLFLCVMWGVFQVTTAGAAPLVEALDGLVNGPLRTAALAVTASTGLRGTWFEGFVLDGLLTGVGMVLAFVPLMGIMFALLALLEDSGYMARAAVVMDRVMGSVGLPGRAFVPLVVGFGCNVPAMSATRVLPDARHRLLTALVVPLTSCSARLPVYVLVASALFGQDAGTVVFAMYVASVVFVVLSARLLRTTVLRHLRDEPLVLDLPRYQVPGVRALMAATRARLVGFLRTATGVIVVAVSAVWLLTALPAHPGTAGFARVPVQDSLFARGAAAVAPVFAPAGFGDWHCAGALVVGAVAKEAIVSSWAQTYGTEEPTEASGPGRLGASLREDLSRTSDGHPRLAGLALLLFVLGYSPCVATLSAQSREIGRRWALTGLGLNLLLSWTVAVCTFQVGRLLL